MSISRLQIKGYRSIRNLRLDLAQINVVVGANGTGKTNIYKALHLVWAAAQGQLARRLAEEGGMRSALWAGDRLKKDQREICIEFEGDELSYALELGIVPLSDRIGDDAMKYFRNDPDIKVENVRVDYRGKKISLLERKRGAIMARNMDGRPLEYPFVVDGSESVLSGLREPHLFPEMSQLRSQILSWRFYHAFSAHTQSGLRASQVPVFTPVLSHDGHDFASALATLVAIEGVQTVQDAIEQAFPEHSLVVDHELYESDGLLEYALQSPDFRRAFRTSELSDGTMQYLCLLVALLSPRPPLLLVLNEPEASIHADLLQPLAKLIIAASKKSQILLTTHSEVLSSYIRKLGPASRIIQLEKVNGASRIVGEGEGEGEGDSGGGGTRDAEDEN